MRHVLERIALRVDDGATQQRILDICKEKAARLPRSGSYAVLVGRMPSAQGRLTYEANGSGESNGNLAVIIVRQGAIVTFMWRRDSQPWTPEALRVDSVVGRVVTK